MNESQAGGPSRVVRLWTGALLVVWIIAQVVTVGIMYKQAYQDAESLEHHERAAVYHHMGVALMVAPLAMALMAAGVGLIVNRRWAYTVIAAAAALQVVVTVVTQVWEAALPQEHAQVPMFRVLSAAIGIIVWSVVPVGLLLLGVIGHRQSGGEHARGIEA